MQEMISIPHLQQLRTLFPDFECILWDMDGTIMKTEPLHINATVEILNHYAAQGPYLTYSEVEDICTGTTDAGILELLQKQGILQTINLDLFIQMKSTYIEALLPSLEMNNIFNIGIQILMKKAKEHNIKQAVVTSSEYSVTHALINYLNLGEYFEFIITRADTVLNKPHPEPYILAMDKLNTTSDKCLIFEDSKTGLLAAKASKAHVIKACWYNS